MFEIEHEGKRLKVHFTDMVPDTFQEGSPVELVGRLNADGDTIESDQMTAKCPSKYEEQLGAKPPQS
jgi:cytochrome c-type biogenesis protein CcmE